MIDLIVKNLACVSIALQMSGALVLISAMKSIDQVVEGVISPNDHAIGTFNEDKTKVLISVDKVKVALANHYYQRFALYYILCGYLGATLFNANAPSGFDDMLIVAVFSGILLLIAIMVVKKLSIKNAIKHAARDSNKVPDGTLLVEYE